MKLPACRHWEEVRELLRRGAWPAGAAAELRQHARECRHCGDLALVAEAFRIERASALREPRLPSSGTQWWRARMRRRNAELARLRKPVLGAQILALAAVSMAAVWLAGVGLGGNSGWHGSLGGAWGAPEPGQGLAGARWLGSAWAWAAQLWSAWTGWDGWRLPQMGLAALIPALALLALLSGVAVFLAAEKQ